MVTVEKRFVWSAFNVAEERDASGSAISKRFFGQGVQLVNETNPGNYFYSKDHLASIRELSDANAVVRARYSYDPFGRMVKLSGDLDAEFGFTGHYVHSTSRLALAPLRAYSAETGRWISRDPVAEAGGINLYAYARNSPTNLSDPTGLCPGDFWDLLDQFLIGANEGAYAALDSAIPFWDPFSDHYNPNDPGIWFSELVGGPALQTLATAGLGEAVAAARGAMASGLGDLLCQKQEPSKRSSMKQEGRLMSSARPPEALAPLRATSTTLSRLRATNIFRV
jgi:RHS repeat-associated protein